MSDNVLRIILIGPPGSGKGTQAVQLCQRYGLGHVSTGDLLRRNTQKGTELGKTAQVCMQSGGLVPDPLIFDMLEDLYNRPGGAQQGFVLDGFPRSHSQAVALSEFLESRDQVINKVLLLELDDELIVGRLIHRRTCPKCGRSYHLHASPPRQEGLCDEDGTELVWRADDKEEVIRNRLATYHSQTEPVTEYYEQKGILARIPASDPIDEVAQRIAAIMDELASKVSR
jgi:adenylate kinase